MESEAGPSSVNNFITYVSSARGNKILIHNDRQYSKSKEYKNGSILWRCLKRTCKGYLTVTSSEKIHKQTAHTCSPCSAEVEVRKALDECRHIAATTCTPIPTLYKNTISKLESKGLNLVTNLPSYKRLKSGLYQHRNRARGANRQISKRNKMKLLSSTSGRCGDGHAMCANHESFSAHRPNIEIVMKDSTPHNFESYKNEFEYLGDPQRNSSRDECEDDQHYGDTVTHDLLRMQIKMKQESLAIKKEFYSTCVEEMRKQTNLLQEIARHVTVVASRNNHSHPCSNNHYQQL